jgi:asparagine synthase (glutamine-hydrolysing)
MHAQIPHRGPDAEGSYFWPPQQPRVGLAFRRLKIVDLSDRSSQPMRSPRSGNVIVFNGEIYNHRTLRAELQSEGYEFTTTSDTEVALAAYDRWGTSVFERLCGMWSIVILDLARERVVVSRDRLAIKPLYWTRLGGRLLFSSEIRQLLAAGAPRRMNHGLAFRFLANNRLPCYDETFFEGIRSFPAASYCEIPLNGDMDAELCFRRFWSLAGVTASSSNGNASYAEASRRFAGLMRATLEEHTQGDVPIGALLSGGLDSGVLTTLLADESLTELPTFSFGFRERAPDWCELRYVDAIVATRRNLSNRETTFDSDWLTGNAARVIRTLEEPPLALPALAQYRVFELCGQHGATVVIDGEGSDEILAGYPPYHRALLMDHARRMHPLRFARELRAIARRQGRSEPSYLLDAFVRPLLRRAKRRSYPWLRPMPIHREPMDTSQDASLVNRMLYAATVWGNVKIVLGYTDKNAMAHSVEARVPFMDHRIVEYSFSLPAEFKVGDGDRKRILRDLGRTLLPPLVTERRDRMGFGTPDHLLMTGSFADQITETVSDPAFQSLAFFDKASLQDLLLEWRTHPAPDLRAIWRLYALATWRNEFEIRG